MTPAGGQRVPFAASNVALEHLRRAAGPLQHGPWSMQDRHTA